MSHTKEFWGRCYVTCYCGPQVAGGGESRRVRLRLFDEPLQDMTIEDALRFADSLYSALHGALGASRPLINGPPDVPVIEITVGPDYTRTGCNECHRGRVLIGNKIVRCPKCNPPPIEERKTPCACFCHVSQRAVCGNTCCADRAGDVT